MDPETPDDLADRYDAVIFDADGVLVELTDWKLVRDAVSETFRSFDVDPDPSDVEAMLGSTLEDVKRVCANHDIEPATFWYRRDMKVSETQRQEIRAGRKGLYDDVQALDALSQPLAVVSNNQQRTIDYLVHHNGMNGRFRRWYGRQPTLTDITRKKPSPHYLQKTLDTLQPETALYVGDSQSDVVAAHRAGIDSAFIRRDHRRDYELDHEPTYEIETLRALVDVER